MTSKLTFLFSFLIFMPVFAEVFLLIENKIEMSQILLAMPQIIIDKCNFAIPILMLAIITPKFSRFALAGMILLVASMLGGTLNDLIKVMLNVDIFGFFSNEVLNNKATYSSSLEWSLSWVKTILLNVFWIGLLVHQYLTRQTKRTVNLLIIGLFIILAANKYWTWDYLNINSKKHFTKVNVEKISIAPNVSTIKSYDGFQKKKTDPRIKRVFLNQDVLGLPTNQFAVLGKLKNIKISFGGGQKFHVGKNLNGSEYDDVNYRKFIKPIHSLLEGTKILNPYKKKLNSTILIHINEDHFNQFKDKPGLYTSDAEFDVYEYKITSVLPLKIGASDSFRTEKVMVYDILESNNGVSIILGEKKVELSLNMKHDKDVNPFSYYSNEEMTYDQAYYVLRNKITNEAFLPEVRDPSMTQKRLMSNSPLKTRTKMFYYTHFNQRNENLPKIDKEWLANAELIRIDTHKIGEFNKKIEYKDLYLSSKSSEEE